MNLKTAALIVAAAPTIADRATTTLNLTGSVELALVSARRAAFIAALGPQEDGVQVD